MSIDLHLHSKASDGSLLPGQVVELASRLNLKTIALTDHDTVDGIDEAIEASKKFGIEVIPGIEMSSDVDGRDIHVLGYNVDYQDRAFLSTLGELKRNRALRAENIIAKLRDLGLVIRMDDIRSQSDDGTLGRAHIARALLKKGYIKDIQEAFNKYIGRNGPAYVGKSAFSVSDIIGIIQGVGGVPVLAHPGISKIDNLIKGFVSDGLKGLEVFHSEHTSLDVDRYRGIAEDLGLIMTGGSDCHGLGSSRGLIMGSVFVPDHCIDDLRIGQSQIRKS